MSDTDATLAAKLAISVAKLAESDAKHAESERALTAEVEALKQSMAEIEALKQSSKAEIEALKAQLAAQRPAQPPAAPPPPRSHAGAAAVLVADAPIVIPSPSKAPEAHSILKTLGSFDFAATPLSEGLRKLAKADSLALWHGLTANEVVDEEQGYPRATASVPGWVEARTRGVSGKGSEAASALFLRALPKPLPKPEWPAVPGATMPWSCQPELLTAPRECFHPAFTGEVKSAHSSGDTKARAHLFDEIFTYAMLGMLGSYFRSVPRGSHRYFRAPPHAFVLAAFPHVGYLVAVEWAGKLHASVVSQPFFVGSAEHAAAVASLPDSDFSAGFVDIDVDGVGVAAWPDDVPGSSSSSSGGGGGGGRRTAVIWRIEAPAADSADARFFKILRGAAFGAAYFRRLADVYAALAKVLAAAGAARPAAVIPAELLFGAGEVCVRMPWVRGRDAAPGDLGAGGVAVAPVAEAIVWLARRGLLYVDLREPNVRVGGGDGGGGDGAARVALVDYDDMVLLKKAPETLDELLEALGDASDAAWAGREDAPGARPAVVAALAAAWAAK